MTNRKAVDDLGHADKADIIEGGVGQHAEQSGKAGADNTQMTPPDSSVSAASRSMPPMITPEISPTVSTAVTMNIIMTGATRISTPA